jgi:predicted extracellular nuclease
MRNQIFQVLSFAALVINSTLSSCFAQIETSHTQRIMFYNTENFFDTYDDSLTDDDDFLPDGLMRWNLTRYNKKINSLHKTIIAAGEWAPPVVVGLCEIENRQVLEDLIFGTYLSKYGYAIIHEDSPDRRGIDVCIIYRKKLADLIFYKYWIPATQKNQKFNSRSVLYTKMAIGSDTVHFIVNHWPSRRGGVLAGEDYRHRIASMIREKVDSIFDYDMSGARIILLGDFNCTTDDPIIQSLLSSSDTLRSLKNLSASIEDKTSGTYRYLGRWEMIDQVIVSKKLLDSKKGLYTELKLLNVFRPDFLLNTDTKYPGPTPFSTYKGFRYQGGFSDHLPVILDLKIR